MSPCVPKSVVVPGYDEHRPQQPAQLHLISGLGMLMTHSSLSPPTCLRRGSNERPGILIGSCAVYSSLKNTSMEFVQGPICTKVLARDRFFIDVAIAPLNLRRRQVKSPTCPESARRTGAATTPGARAFPPPIGMSLANHPVSSQFSHLPVSRIQLSLSSSVPAAGNGWDR
jgi:hypothetical protein